MSIKKKIEAQIQSAGESNEELLEKKAEIVAQLEKLESAMEAALHRAFADRKLNFVNTRREFFRVTLDEIKAVVKANFDKTVEFIDVPPAEQYRQSLLMAQQANRREGIG